MYLICIDSTLIEQLLILCQMLLLQLVVELLQHSCYTLQGQSMSGTMTAT